MAEPSRGQDFTSQFTTSQQADIDAGRQVDFNTPIEQEPVPEEPVAVPEFTGNTQIDLANLQKAGATPSQVAEYMAEYGKSFAGVEAWTDTKYDFATTPPANLTPEQTEQWKKEVEFAKQSVAQQRELGAYLKSTGYDPSKPYIELQSPDPKVGIVRVQADLYEKATPQQKFSLLQKFGEIPKEATFDKKSGGYTIPTAKKFAVGDVSLGKSQLAYIRENDPELYRDIQDRGLGAVYAEKADVIENRRVEATLTPELRQVFVQAGGGQTGIDAVNNAVSRRVQEQRFTNQQEYEQTVMQLNESRDDALNKLELAGYRLTREQLGETVMTSKGDTTKHYTDQYDIAGFLRDATNKDLNTPTIGIRTKPEQVWNVDRGVWEDTGIIQTKSVEQRLSENGTNYKTALAVLKDAGFSDEVINKATTVVLMKQGVTVGPSTAKRPLGIQVAVSKLEFGLEKWLGEKDTEFREKLTIQGPVASAIAGTGSALLTMAVAMPMLIAKIGTDPSKTPEVAASAVKDMASQVSNTVRTYATSAKTGFQISPYDLAYNTTTTVLILAPVVGVAKGFVGKVTVYVSPRGLTPGMIAKELSTGRIKLKEGLDQAMTEGLTEALRQSMRKDTPFTGEVPVPGTSLKFRYLKSPINEVIGDIRWHGTKDALNFVRDQLEVTVIDGKKTVKVNIPAGSELTNAVMKLKTYSNEAIAALDTPQVRPLKFTDAVDIPKELAKITQDYVKTNNGKVYGSFVDWIKSKNAVRPNDIDLVFKTTRDAKIAKEFLRQEAVNRGFQVQVNDRGVQIQIGTEWKTIANIVDETSHAEMMRGGGFKEHTVVSNEGIVTTTSGTQIVNQALGTLKKSPKSATRAGKVIQSAPQIAKVAEVQGVTPSTIPGTSGTFIAGEGGLYTDSWAAFQYTRGDNPGLLMIIDDASNIKTARVAKLTESADFIGKAKEDTFGPSKIYKGDLETEIVDAPGKRFAIPDPKADLVTRTLVGEFADFFTYDNGRFVPIKLAVSESLMKSGNVRMPTVKELYKTKLLTTINALRDTSEALRHPIAIGQDAVRSIKALKDVDPLYGSGHGGNTTTWGVRDIYLQTDWGLKMKGLVDRLFKRAEEKTDAKANSMGIKRSSKAYQDMLRGNMKDSYDASARSMIRDFGNVSVAYSTSVGAREIFETAYAARLGQSVETMFREQNIQGTSLTNTLRDVESYTSVSPVASPRETVSSLDSSRQATERSVSPVSRDNVAVSESQGITESNRPMVSEVSRVTEEQRPVSEERISTDDRRPVTEERRPTTEEHRTVEEVRRPVEERRPTEERRPPPPPPPPTGLARLQTNSPTSQPIPDGSIAWAMGERKGIRGMLVPQWYYIPPEDFGAAAKPRSLSAPPQGARVTDSVKPSETIQIIGRSRITRVPKEVTMDLGFTDIIITNGNQISFAGSGLKTDVGTRVASNTTGMSVDEGGDYLTDESYSTQRSKTKAKKSSNVNRTKMSKKRPNRLGDGSSGFDSVVSLRGLRL
jgi:hypothetical protein